MLILDFNTVVKQKKKRKKIFIGRYDKIDLPDLGLYDIDAKVDTGAFSSSIHCHNITPYKKNGKDILKFNLLDPSHPEYDGQEFIVTKFNQKIVRNSFGQEEERYAFKTAIVLFGRTIRTEFSLSNRENMKYPVLLGRTLLYNRFIVDVTKYNLSYNKKKGKENLSNEDSNTLERH